MRITIAERLRPFSHRPGTALIVPGTTIRVQIFPALICLENKEIPLPIRGPVEQFTICQDLEAGHLRVWGKTVDGFRRYTIQGLDQRLVLQMEKGDEILLGYVKDLASAPRERLSLGSHKAQEWDRLYQNLDLVTLLPSWHRLGQMIPWNGPHFRTGTAALLGKCEDLLHTPGPEAVGPALSTLLQAGFDGLLAPRLKDTDHLGIDFPEPSSEENPLVLLTEGAKFIRRLFFQQQQDQLRVLPFLPPEFHAGRMTGITTGFGTLDFEWSSKVIRRAIFHAEQACRLQFHFKGGVQTFRLRRGHSDHGTRLEGGSQLSFEPGDYFFDNFMK